MASSQPSSRLQERLRDKRSSSRGPDTKSTPPSKPAAKPKSDNRKTFLDNWVEPPLKTTASYQDHGGAPYGVMENMQPLGEKPNAKVKGRVKPDAMRKSLLGRGAAAAAGGLDGAQDTPEGTPVPQATPQPETNGKRTRAARESVRYDYDEEDYAPGSNTKERAVKSRSAKRRSEVPEQREEKPTSSKKKKGRGKAHVRAYTGEKLYNVVEAAKKTAIGAGKPDLADAVNEIYKSSLTDDNLADLLDAVLQQTTTPAQVTEFQDYVRKVKKAKREKENLKKAMSANGHSPLKSVTRETTTTSPRSNRKQRSPLRRQSSMAKKPRSASVGSDSSLSSLTSTSTAGDNAIEEPEAAQPKKKAVEQAQERESLAPPDRNLKRSSADVVDPAADEKERAIATKKRKLGETVARDYAYEESDVRSDIYQSSSNRGAKNSGRKPATLKLHNRRRPGRDDSPLITPTINTTPGRKRKTRSSGDDDGDDDEENEEPPTSPLTSTGILSPRSPPPYPPGSYDYGSPRNPPRQAKLPALKDSLKPPGKRAKTKTSPEKKPSYNAAGVSGTSGARRESPIGDEHNEEASENNDFCSACSASGYLLCCDGCDRSFHFECLDPPLHDDAKELNEPWYCFVCIAKRPLLAEQQEKAPRGLFGPLLNALRPRNPTNFALPAYIQEYFEGVASDKHGNFVESVHPRVGRNARGYDELPDYFKTKDSKGNLITCHRCFETASKQPQRMIVKCDYCDDYWHLDCMDPPLANPPPRRVENGKRNHDFKCPAHSDLELQYMPILGTQNPRKVTIRRPRNPKIIDTSLNRGHRNNGIIEVIDDESESEDEFYDEETPDGAEIYRVPAMGLKLDFITKIKNDRIQQLRDQRVYEQLAPPVLPPSALEQANFARRSFREKQVALNLAQFATSEENKDLDFGSNQVDTLLGTLIAEAPAAVIEQLTAQEEAETVRSSASAIPPSPPTSEQTISQFDRKELEKLQELIRRKLESANP